MKKLIITLVIVVFAMLLLGVGRTRDEPIGYKECIVSQGDTLWDIAEGITPEHIDLRHTVHIIQKENSIDNSDIYAGQAITVPVWERGEK